LDRGIRSILLIAKTTSRGIFSFGLALALLAGCPLSALAQPTPSFDWHSGKTELATGWRTHSGDDLAWAAANFDDSAWAPFTFTSSESAVLSPAPTWNWYRLRLHLPDTGQPTALLVQGVRGEYEVYLNGVLQPGSRLASRFVLFRSSTAIFPLDTPGGDMEIALRTRVPAIYESGSPVSAVVIGTRDVLTAQANVENNLPLHAFILPQVIYLLITLTGVAIFALYRAQPTHREYLWLSLCLLSLGANAVFWNASVIAGLLPMSVLSYFADPFVYPWLVAQIEFVYSFAGRKPSRAVRVYEVICLLVPLYLNFGTLFFPIRWTVGTLGETLVVLPVALGLPILLTLWYRRGNREAGWLILPVLLTSTSLVTYDGGFVLGELGLRPTTLDLIPPLKLGPYQLEYGSISSLVFLVFITIVIFLRFTRVSREQSRIKAELSAAQELQSRLVPAIPPPVPGFAFEAVYLPAAEVGGDFYQVLEQADGSALIVIGDVSGKGLKAAMTGALVIGALRTLAAENLSPATLLEKLNLQLVQGNDGGFVTCLCVRVDANGAITLANAGHLAPYRNGTELPVDFGLPLGITAEARYSEASIQLAPGDQLTLLSDGVLEARTAAGELYGFDRTRTLSTAPAEVIASTVQRFGQEDDITVLTLAYAPAAVNTMKPVCEPA
jgi:hypothetical protein